MKMLKQVLGGDFRQYTMVIALVVLLVMFQFLTGGLFDGKIFTPTSFQNLLIGNTYVLVLAIGMVMVIVVGHIDLSVGSVAGFVAMCAALSGQNLNFPWWLMILTGLAIGLLIGSWQGFWLSRVGIPGFITTLAGMMIFRGGVIWISGSISRPVPKELTNLGAGYLPEWGPAWTGMNNSTLLLGAVAIAAVAWTQMRKFRKRVAYGETDASLEATVYRILLIGAVIAFVTYLYGSGDPGTSFPVPGVILVVLVLIYHTLTQRTTLGRHIYAVGGNRVAAQLSGVSVKNTYFFVMANMSFLAAIAGMLAAGRSTSAGPQDGNMWELDAIAAVFIGGAAVSGGIGTVVASMVGGLVMAVLNQGLQLCGVGQDQTQVIKGLVLLAAVAFDVWNKQQGRPSITGRLFGSKTEAGTPEAGGPARADATTNGQAHIEDGPVLAADGPATTEPRPGAAL